MKLISDILLLLCFPYLLFAQSNNTFIPFRTDNSDIPSNKIYCIAVDSNNVKWIATDKGLASFDGINWEVFNNSNGLLSNNVTAVVIDKSNNIWIIDSVLSKYNGTDWVHYTRDNYVNASISSQTLAIDENNVKWMTTINSYGGRDVCSFNDTIFTIFDWGNSTYELRSVWNIKTYKNEKWIVDYATLWKYDDNKLLKIDFDSLTSTKKYGIIDAFNITQNGYILLSTHYSLGNPEAGIIDYFNIYEIVDENKYYRINGLPDGFCFAIAAEDDSIKWFGVNYDLYKIKNEKISSFRSDFDLSRLGIIVVDKLGNKWLASHYDWYNNGVCVFKENGVILTSVKDDIEYLSSNYKLEQNYPNPFNPTTTINYSILSNSLVKLELFDILGNKIKTLVNEYKSNGNYSYILNMNEFASGIYIYSLINKDTRINKKLIYLK